VRRYERCHFPPSSMLTATSVWGTSPNPQAARTIAPSACLIFSQSVPPVDGAAAAAPSREVARPHSHGGTLSELSARPAAALLRALLRGLREVPSWSEESLGRSWLLSDLFVLPAARRRGVGRLLLTHCRRFAADSGAAARRSSRCTPPRRAVRS